MFWLELLAVAVLGAVVGLVLGPFQRRRDQQSVLLAFAQLRSPGASHHAVVPRPRRLADPVLPERRHPLCGSGQQGARCRTGTQGVARVGAQTGRETVLRGRRFSQRCAGRRGLWRTGRNRLRASHQDPHRSALWFDGCQTHVVPEMPVLRPAVREQPRRSRPRSAQGPTPTDARSQAAPICPDDRSRAHVRPEPEATPLRHRDRTTRTTPTPCRLRRPRVGCLNRPPPRLRPSAQRPTQQSRSNPLPSALTCNDARAGDLDREVSQDRPNLRLTSLAAYRPGEPLGGVLCELGTDVGVDVSRGDDGAVAQSVRDPTAAIEWGGARRTSHRPPDECRRERGAAWVSGRAGASGSSR
jgi:hypothetical protein